MLDSSSDNEATQTCIAGKINPIGQLTCLAHNFRAQGNMLTDYRLYSSMGFACTRKVAYIYHRPVI